MYRLRLFPPIVYQLLNTVHHQGLRFSFVAFRASPVESLYVQENEPSHENRRINHGMQYATTLTAYPSNPAKTVFNPLYENDDDNQPNTIQPFGIHLDDIAPNVIPENPPWLSPKPIFNVELTQCKKSETFLLLIQQHFAVIRSVTSEYSAIHTAVSKDGDNGDRVQVYSVRLPSTSSIFSAEANAMFLVFKFVASSYKCKFRICSDSLSCLLPIESCKTQTLF